MVVSTGKKESSQAKSSTPELPIREEAVITTATRKSTVIAVALAAQSSGQNLADLPGQRFGDLRQLRELSADGHDPARTHHSVRTNSWDHRVIDIVKGDIS
jgi:hypothetical protein